MYFVNETIKDLYRVKFHESRAAVLRLDMNENPEGLPPDFVEAVKKKITPSLLASYPEKDELTDLIARHNGISAACVSITSGSDEAMRLIFQCFGEAGKKVVTVSPTFEMYDVYSKMFEMLHKDVSYQADFSVAVQDILVSIDEKTGLVILLNPNSPIGTAYSREDARRIIEKAGKCGALVVVDEAYHYFHQSTFMDFVEQYPHVAVLRTFSKLCSVAGLRIGYVAGNAQLIHYIENAESTFNVNNVALLFAKEILMRPELMEELRKTEEEGHQWIFAQLQKSGYTAFSSHGNYVLFQAKRPAGEIVAALKKQGIWIRDYNRGMLSGWLRISTGSIGVMQTFWKQFVAVDG